MTWTQAKRERVTRTNRTNVRPFLSAVLNVNSEFARKLKPMAIA